MPRPRRPRSRADDYADDDHLDDDDDDDDAVDDAFGSTLLGMDVAVARRAKALAVRVRELLEDLPAKVKVEAKNHRPLPLHLERDGRSVVGHAYLSAGYATAALDEVAGGAMRGRCSCPATPRCVHLALLLGEVARLLERGEPILSRFVDRLEPPGFAERLDRLDPWMKAPSAGDAGDRLRLRLKVIRDLGQLELVSQKRRKNGSYSAGRVISARDLFLRVPRSASERLLLSTLADLSSFAELPVVSTLLALRSTPGTVMDDAGRDLVVVAAQFGFGVERSPDGGYRALPTFNGELRGANVVVTRAGAVAVVEERGEVLVAQASDELLRLARLLLAEPLVAPAELAPLLVERLSRLEPSVTLTLPPLLAGRVVERDDRTVLVMEPVRDGATVTVRLRPLPGGPLVVPGEDPQELSRLIDGERRRVTRSLAAERDQAAAVLGELGLAPDDDGLIDLGNEGVLDLLQRLREPPLDTRVVLEWPKNHRPPEVVRAGELRVRVNALADWFGVEGSLEVDGQVLELALLLDAVREGRRFVPAGDRKFVNIERLFRGRLSQLADVTRVTRRGLELTRHAAAVAPDLLEGEEVVTPLDWQALMTRARGARELSPQLPAALRAELRDYQLEGYKWMRRLAELGTGAVLADDMGLGKTVQAIAMLVERAPLGPQLVVAPTSVGFNWIRELVRFAPGLRAVAYREGDRKAAVEAAGPGDVLVSSYGLVRVEGSPLAARRWTTLVLDEAHAVKSWQSATAKAVRALQADWTVALTGTPVENHLGELWSLLQTVCPGLLGGWEEFSRSFATPIEKGRSEPRRRALSRLLRPFLLRRTKGEVLRELPARTELRLDAVLSKTERALYESARIAALAQLEKGGAGEDGRFAMLAALTRLRQLASHARMVTPEAPAVSAKLAVLLEALEEAREEGHRCLVFSQFVTHLALIREALVARGTTPLQLDGSTPAAERARLVDRFQHGDVPVLLVSLKAGGTGLNLTAADTVFLMDPWWNPAVEDQAADRAHRIGQTRPVTVVRIVAKGTVEEKVLQMHDRKRALVASVLDGSDASGKLSTSELMDLLAEAPAAFNEDADEPEPVPELPSNKPSPSARRGALLAPAAPAPKPRGSAWPPHLDGFRRSLVSVAAGSAAAYVAAVRRVVQELPGVEPAKDLETALARTTWNGVTATALARFLRYLYAADVLDRAQADALAAILAAHRG